MSLRKSVCIYQTTRYHAVKDACYYSQGRHTREHILLQDRQCMYNVILMRVRVTIVVVEKQ